MTTPQRELSGGLLNVGGPGESMIRIYGDMECGALRENGRYEYELSSPDFLLMEVSGVIRHSRIRQDCERGTIEPGNFVGLLKLELVEKGTDAVVAETHVEVRSRKLFYDTEYRRMLEAHPLRGRLGSLPETLTVVDTAENRFVKYALQMFLSCL